MWSPMARKICQSLLTQFDHLEVEADPRSRASRVDALAVHSLASAADIAAMHAAGIASIRATDSVAGPLAQLPLASALAQAIINQGWTGAPRT